MMPNTNIKKTKKVKVFIKSLIELNRESISFFKLGISLIFFIGLNTLIVLMTFTEGKSVVPVMVIKNPIKLTKAIMQSIIFQ